MAAYQKQLAGGQLSQEEQNLLQGSNPYAVKGFWDFSPPKTYQEVLDNARQKETEAYATIGNKKAGIPNRLDTQSWYNHLNEENYQQSLGDLAQAQRLENDNRRNFQQRTGEINPSTGEELAMTGATAAYSALNFAENVMALRGLKGTVPSTGVAEALGMGTLGKVVSPVTGIAKTAAAEGATEFAQNQIENSWGNLSTDFDLVDNVEAGVLGAAMGAGFAAPGSVIQAGRVATDAIPDLQAKYDQFKVKADENRAKFADNPEMLAKVEELIAQKDELLQSQITRAQDISNDMDTYIARRDELKATLDRTQENYDAFNSYYQNLQPENSIQRTEADEILQAPSISQAKRIQELMADENVPEATRSTLRVVNDAIIAQNHKHKKLLII